MLNFVDDKLTRQQINRKCRENVCSQCNSPVNAFYDQTTKRVFIACSQYPVSHHEGIIREASNLKMKGMSVLNQIDRREKMVNQYGKEKVTALQRYEGLTSLTKEDATTIVKTIWPGATGAEVFKAINVCVTYALNPLMKHVYLVPFENKKTGKDEYVCVLGIGATRLIASRKHKYSYLDDTPRIMNEAEEIKKYGKLDKTKIRFVTKLKDIQSGAEASGWGEISASATVYGGDKGNSRENLAAIRSERQALDRLYPADMPGADIPVMDDNYMDSTTTVIEEEPTKASDHLTGMAHVGEPPPDTPPAPADKPQDAPQTAEKPQRDPSTIKTVTDMYKAVHADFGLQPKETMAELNIRAWSELVVTPVEAYNQIASVRNK